MRRPRRLRSRRWCKAPSLPHAGTSGADAEKFPRDNELLLQQFSLFYGGRIAEHFGASPSGPTTASSIIARSITSTSATRGTCSARSLELSYGVTLNNIRPFRTFTIRRRRGAFRSHRRASRSRLTPRRHRRRAGPTGRRARRVRAVEPGHIREVAGYRTADRALSIFRAGTDRTTAAVLDGTAPYWRLAVQHGWGEGTPHAAMIGTYGIDAHKFPDSLTDRPERPLSGHRRRRPVPVHHRPPSLFGAAQLDQREPDPRGDPGGGGREQFDRHAADLQGQGDYYYDQKYGVSSSTSGRREPPTMPFTTPAIR